LQEANGDRVFRNQTIWNIIGRDGAPSFKWFVLAHRIFNANGELAVKNTRIEPVCD
jgi:hypothetical protein